MKLASRYMIVKKTFKKYSKIRSESFYKRKRRWFWFTGSMLTLTNPFLEAGPFPLGAFALDSSPEPRNANGGTRQRAESGHAGGARVPEAPVLVTASVPKRSRVTFCPSVV